ncbi:hypothetical protein [Niabella hibiscisoli]|uniref:hypothetical protein n=1 Tax=Niabella hibiscisoli TaxID=1825928 RepID=UPI001F109CAA|nr:hypothetical protein [Niabella hibiscisoli]MCH5721096.1 hypothetical protein [Niabella hibiscisoli]
MSDNLANGVSNVCLLVTAPLPVNFSVVEATILNHSLSVNWATFSETDNSHFEIEISADGKQFTKIGEVKTRAVNGNSDEPLTYTFTGDLHSVAAWSGAIAFMLLGGAGLGFNRRKKYVFTLLTVAGIAAGIVACSKNDKEVIGNDGKLFVRIAQVDKDGTKKYSKVVLVNRK